MKHVCAWCGVTTAPEDERGEGTSHGVCEACATKIKADAEEFVAQYMRDITSKEHGGVK